MSRSSKMFREPFAEGGPAGIAAGDHVEPEAAQPGRQPGRLGRLAAAVRPVEHQEQPRVRMGARCASLVRHSSSFFLSQASASANTWRILVW